jgi:hypothetical protein
MAIVVPYFSYLSCNRFIERNTRPVHNPTIRSISADDNARDSSRRDSL